MYISIPQTNSLAASSSSTSNQIIQTESIINKLLSINQAQGAMSIYILMQGRIRNNVDRAWWKLNEIGLSQKRDNKSYKNIANTLKILEQNEISSVESRRNHRSKVEVINQKKQLLEDTLNKLLNGKSYHKDKAMLNQIQTRISGLEGLLKNMAKDLIMLDQNQSQYKLAVQQNIFRSANYLSIKDLPYQTKKSIPSNSEYIPDYISPLQHYSSHNRINPIQKVNIYYQSPPQRNYPSPSSVLKTISPKIKTTKQNHNIQQSQNKRPQTTNIQIKSTFNKQNTDTKRPPRKMINILSPCPYRKK